MARAVSVSGLLHSAGSSTSSVFYDLPTNALVVREADLVLPKGEGFGVKVDASADNQSFPFRDITGEVQTRGVGPTDPAWAQIGSGPFFAYQFAVNDVCWIAFHIPHDYVTDIDGTASPIFLHCHWLPDGTNTNIVKWQFDYTYAHGHNQAAFDSTGTQITSQEAPPGTAYQHMVTETAAFTVSDMEPDGILYVKMTRVTNGGTENTDGIFVLTLDVYYQSTNIGTKNRSPGFYA